MSETIKTDVCHRLRTEIHKMIFPRWALVLAGGMIFMSLAWLLNANLDTGTTAADAQKKAELVEVKLTTEIEHVKEDLGEIKIMQHEQRVILQRIDRSLNGG